MSSAIELLESDLAEVREQLAGYNELKEQEQRLAGALALLKGETMPPMKGSNGSARRSRNGTSSKTLNENEIIHAIHAYGEPAPQQAIREALGLSDSDSNRLTIKLGAMVNNGLLKREGERRASRYTPA